MGARSYLSIGDVLTLLRQEFPDVTISKIRFLESQGLVNPERTPSGYRKFYEHDVERLRWVLRQQRENFLPLKVIKDRLDDESAGAGGDLDGAAESEGAATAPEPVLVGQHSTNGGHAATASGSSLEGVPAGGTHSAGPPAPATTVAEHAEGTTLPGIESVGAESNGTSGSGAPAAVRRTGTASTAKPAAPVAARTAPHRSTSPAPAGVPRRARTPSDPTGPAPARPVVRAEPDAATSERTVPDAAPESDGTVVGSTTPAARMPGAAAAGGSDLSTGRPATRGPAAGRRPSAQTGPAPTDAPSHRPEVSLTLEELASASGLDIAVLEDLVEYGLMVQTRVGGLPCFDAEALAVATLAAGFARFGVEPRHLRLYKNAADREAGFVEQIVLPLVRQRNPEARVRANETADELARLGQQLRASLVRSALSDLLDG